MDEINNERGRGENLVMLKEIRRLPESAKLWHIVAILVVWALFVPTTARGENERRQVIEGEVSMTFAEHLGRSPLVAAGAGLELGVGRSLGIHFGGFALVGSERALPFFQETGVGGGINLALRFHVRGNWPRGFGIGIAASMGVIEGVALLNPRAELSYRFVLLSHLSLRIIAAGGGMFLWDTQPSDDRPGPASREGYVADSLSGVSISVGVAIGWSGAREPPRHAEDIEDPE